MEFIRVRYRSGMVGDSNEFVAAHDGSIRHLANLAGAIAPIYMHLQIAPKARAPRRRSSQPKATFSQGAKFFPQRRRTREMALLPNPSANLFLKKRPNMRQLCQRALLCD